MGKRRSGLLLIAFGVVAALVVGALVFIQMSKASSGKIETVNVLVSLRDIPERTVLKAEDVTLRGVLPDGLPPGVLNSPEQATGQMTTSRLFAGEMILASRLADTAGRSGIAYTLPPGKVLITLQGSDIIGVGAVRPGDHVDLLATVLPATDQPGTLLARPKPTGEEIAEATTQTTMQNLVIVGIGPIAVPTKDGIIAAPATGSSAVGASLLTFAVTHEEALIIKHLKDSKSVRLEIVLRAAGDEEIVETEAVTLQALLEKYRIRSGPARASQ